MRSAAVVGLLLGLAGPAAYACGYCVEDKIAATYDHAVVSKAMARKHYVAFFHVDGAPAPQNRRALERALHAVAAVEKGSARISPDALTVSFSFDPARASLASINSQLDQRLAAHKLSLMPLRVLEQPGELKAIGR